MRTHIIITGHARSFARCWPNIRWNVARRLANPVFHVSIHDDEQGREMVRKIAESGYDVHSEYVDQPQEWPDYGNAHEHAPYAISVPIPAILGQLWRLQRGWEFAEHMVESGDNVVRLRPDLWFHKPIDATNKRLGMWVEHPWWGNFGGINDRFAVMAADSADYYFGAFAKIQKAIDAGCPLHPESLLAFACNPLFKIKADFLFSTIRATGEQRWPEILPGETPPQ